MPPVKKPTVAIVDYGMGNLYSVKHACLSAGLRPTITASKKIILAADGVILPGVGAFGDAMLVLNTLGLIRPLQEVIRKNTPFLGICLGMQLLMSESHEFGSHKGLCVFPGHVVRLKSKRKQEGWQVKVPHVGWNQLIPPESFSWKNSFLAGLPRGTFMYFVHSFHVKPADQTLILAKTQYGSNIFYSAIQKDNIFACQFHPEWSGPNGMKIYQNFAKCIQGKR